MLATIGPIADELLVFPSTVLKGTPEDAPYSFAFAINCDAPGLRFICRESLDYGRGHFDHPLGSRFEEIDSVVVFDDVHVPFERCFLLGHPELCNTFYTDTTAAAHMTHQVATRTMAKTEAMVGIARCMAEAIGIDSLPAHPGGHRRADRDARDRARAGAQRRGRRGAQRVRSDDAEDGSAERLPQLVPEASQRFPQILRKFGASGLMALPTQADIEGGAHEDIERYLQSATLAGRSRAALPARLGHVDVGLRRAPDAV